MLDSLHLILLSFTTNGAFIYKKTATLTRRPCGLQLVNMHSIFNMRITLAFLIACDIQSREIIDSTNLCI